MATHSYYTASAAELKVYTDFMMTTVMDATEYDDTLAPRVAHEFIVAGLLGHKPDLVYSGDGLQTYMKGCFGEVREGWTVETADAQLVFDLIHEKQYHFALAVHLTCVRANQTVKDAVAFGFIRRIYRKGVRGENGRAGPLDEEPMSAAESEYWIEWTFNASCITSMLLKWDAGTRASPPCVLFHALRETAVRYKLQRFLLRAVDPHGLVARCVAMQLMVADKPSFEYFTTSDGRPRSRVLEDGCHATTGLVPAYTMYIHRDADSAASSVSVVFDDRGWVVTDNENMRLVGKEDIRVRAITRYERLRDILQGHAVGVVAADRRDAAAWTFLYRRTRVRVVNVVDIGEVQVAEQMEKLHVVLFAKAFAKKHWTRLAHEYSDAQYGHGEMTAELRAEYRQYVLWVGADLRRQIATLMLGIQRLEAMGVLLLAHQAMFEEMLECLDVNDVREA